MDDGSTRESGGDGGTSRIGIVTGHRAPELSEDGKRVAAALERRGFAVEPVMFDDESADWADFDAGIVRSCWDYHTDVGRFRDLLAEMDRAGVTVCNPLEVIRWNLHKSYVADLAGAGVSLPETTVVERGSDASLEAVLERTGLEEAVVKPAIGTSSTDVWRTSAGHEGEGSHDGANGHGDGAGGHGDPQDRFESMLAGGDVLVQRFVPAIDDGERSIVFFGGEYSHAWNSPTVDGDFTDFGDADAGYDPDPATVDRASEVVETAREIVGIDDPLPYARVDYVEPDGGFLLMELELIEPYLGLDRGEDTVERFASALTDRIRRARSND